MRFSENDTVSVTGLLVVSKEGDVENEFPEKLRIHTWMTLWGFGIEVFADIHVDQYGDFRATGIEFERGHREQLMGPKPPPWVQFYALDAVVDLIEQHLSEHPEELDGINPPYSVFPDRSRV